MNPLMALEPLMKESKLSELSQKVDIKSINLKDLDKPIVKDISEQKKSDLSKCIEKIAKDDSDEANLEKILESYFKDLKDKSEYPDTISDKPFSVSELKILSPEENSKMRDEFDDKKAELKKEWEEKNGRPWPKYDHDVYSASGKLIRKEGSDYDAHHIQPLGMGGKNEASNITPLNAEVHYDKQGIHSPDSPYSNMNKELGGN